MPPKGRKGRRKKETGPKRRRLKRPLFSRFDIRLLYTEFLENFHKCDRDSDKLAAIPMEHLAKALRMCGLTPPEKLVALLEERMEKQEPLRTPVPSDDEEEEEEEDDDPWLEEELEILKQLQTHSPSQVLREKIKKKKAEKSEEKEGDDEGEEEDAGEDGGREGEDGGREGEKRSKRSRRSRSKRSRRKEREEEEERRRAEEEEERLRLEEEERLREEEEERLRLEEEEAKKKKPKRELKWPYAKKKEEIKKVAKMRIRYRHFCKWAEFEQIMQLYIDKQYTGQDLLWAFMTLDPKWDYELEPTWYYGADEPLVPTDEIDNELTYAFITGRQERFIEKEAKRFVRLADFRKETFFNYRELVQDMCQEANYDFGVAKKKKKLKLKES